MKHVVLLLLLALFNATLYAVLVGVIVWQHFAGTGAWRRQTWVTNALQMGAAGLVAAALLTGFGTRGTEGLHALAFGMEPLSLVRAEYGIAGAGHEAKGRIRFVWDPRWQWSASDEFPGSY